MMEQETCAQVPLVFRNPGSFSIKWQLNPTIYVHRETSPMGHTLLDTLSLLLSFHCFCLTGSVCSSGQEADADSRQKLLSP